VKFVMSLLEVFRNDVRMMADRGTFIIRQLCVMLDAEDMFGALAALLTHEEDLQFAAQMVQSLNCILLTSPELFTMRNHLKEFKSEKCAELFTSLYKCWVHQPVALISLCLLTRNYQHAARLIQLFGELEITVEFLTEIDKLIQLLESPIFTYLRLQLLDPIHQPYLATVLYGSLMLLPQTKAFHTLHRRLQCLPQAVTPASVPQPKSYTQENGNVNGVCVDLQSKIDFKSLLVHFQDVQQRQKMFRRLKMNELLK